MRSPGAAVADWIVNDPRRPTLTPRTDRAFYTAMVNISLVLFGIAAVVVLLAVLGVSW